MIPIIIIKCSGFRRGCLERRQFWDLVSPPPDTQTHLSPGTRKVYRGIQVHKVPSDSGAAAIDSIWGRSGQLRGSSPLEVRRSVKKRAGAGAGCFSGPRMYGPSQ